MRRCRTSPTGHWANLWLSSCSLFDVFFFQQKNGGENRIRTCEPLARLHAFQACSFNHSDTSPAPIILSYFPAFVIPTFNRASPLLHIDFFAIL